MEDLEKKEIEIWEAVFARNMEMAAELNRKLTEKMVFTVNVLGAPGVGKTSSLIQIVKRINEQSYVIEGDVESDIDAKKLNTLGINTTQINTGGACHLDTPSIEEAIEKLNPNNGFLFIENIGNLICPAEFMIGEHIKLLISCVTEGSDKPYKYPLAFEKADIILLNKCDLMQYVDFDYEFYLNGVKKLNEHARVFKVSGKTGEGFDEAVQWIMKKANTSF